MNKENIKGLKVKRSIKLNANLCRHYGQNNYLPWQIIKKSGLLNLTQNYRNKLYSVPLLSANFADFLPTKRFELKKKKKN